MFTATMRPFEVVDEAGIRLTWHERLPEVKVTYPRTHQADYPHRGRYRAKVTFTRWVYEDKTTTLVVTYSMMGEVPAKVERRRRLWSDRFRRVASGGVGDPKGQWVYASPRHDAHLVAEGLAVLFSSVPEIARRFNRVEVHRVLNGDQRWVFTGGYPGIADAVKDFEAERARLARQKTEEMLGRPRGGENA